MTGLEFIQQLLLFSAIGFLGIIVFGLYKPAYVIWWERMQNRRTVLKIYGTIFIGCITGYLILLVL